jgi:hypothetical protein
MNRLISILAILILAVVVVVIFWPKHEKISDTQINTFEDCADLYPIMESYPPQCRTADGRSFVQDIGNELEKMDLIKVSKPRPNANIESPLDIEGQARGTWFFEGTFSIILKNSRGQIMALTQAQAQGNWMTEEFVNFTAKIEFSKTETDTGNLYFYKDNPSGITEFDDELRVPVQFK